MTSTGAEFTALQQLGTFVSNSRYADLPAETQWLAKCRLLDGLACVVAGRNSPASKLALTYADQVKGTGSVSIWLSDIKASAENSVFANSIFIHGTLLDDLPIHAACVVIPCALALGEASGRSGADILAAIALGYEVQLRLNSGELAHVLMMRGFRHSSVHATFAATATSGYLLGLDAAAMANALGLTTATLNPGTMEPMGKGDASERFVQMASNAKNGVLSAMLAKAGFTGSPIGLEGRAGIFQTYGGSPELPAGLLQDLGDVWHLDAMMLKPYPCSGHGTLPVYCADRLVGEHKPDVADIAAIELHTRAWGDMVGVVDGGPFSTAEQAMVSARFGIAATLIHGSYDVDVVLRSIGDPAVDALAQRIEVHVSEAAMKNGADTELKVTLKDGRVLSATAQDMPPSLIRQIGWDNIVERFNRLAKHIPADIRQRIVSEVESFDERESCDELVGLLRSLT